MASTAAKKNGAGGGSFKRKGISGAQRWEKQAHAALARQGPVQTQNFVNFPSWIEIKKKAGGTLGVWAARM